MGVPIISPDKVPNSEIIGQMIKWSYHTGIFRTALDLRLWEKIAAGADTAEKLAAREGWDPMGTRILLDAIAQLELLTKQEDRYALVPEAEYYLIPGKPTYKGSLPLDEFNWEGNGRFAEAIRTGKRPFHYEATTADLASMWIADYSRNWAYPESYLASWDQLWHSLGIQPHNGLRVLDIASGPAPRSLALARGHPGVRLTWLDWEDILQTAVKAASQLGIADQVTCLPGDLRSLDYGSSLFDAAYLGNITHFFSPDQNIRLFRKVWEVLVPGGLIVVNSDARRDCELPAWIEVWLYAVSTSGAAYNLAEYKAMLESAGYRNVEEINQGPIKAGKP